MSIILSFLDIPHSETSINERVSDSDFAISHCTCLTLFAFADRRLCLKQVEDIFFVEIDRNTTNIALNGEFLFRFFLPLFSIGLNLGPGRFNGIVCYLQCQLLQFGSYFDWPSLGRFGPFLILLIFSANFDGKICEKSVCWSNSEAERSRLSSMIDFSGSNLPGGESKFDTICLVWLIVQ